MPVEILQRPADMLSPEGPPATPSNEQLPPEGPRLIFLYNPASTRAERAMTAYEQLCSRAERARFIGVTALPTEADPEANRQQIYSHVQPGDVLIVAAGDGGTNAVGDALLHPDAPAHMADVPVLPLPYGRKSDLANTFNRFGGLLGKAFSWFRWHGVMKALRDRRTVPMYPMQAEFQPDNGAQPFKKTAIYALGWGMTGEGAKTINDQAWRAKDRAKPTPPSAKRKLTPIKNLALAVRRLKNEVQLVGSVLKESKPVTINGRPVFDVTVANGPRMAGFWHFMVRPHTKEMIISETRNYWNVPINLAARVLRLGFGVWQRGVYKLLLADDTPMTFDGEQFTAPAGKVDIRHSNKPLHFITSKRKYWGAGDE